MFWHKFSAPTKKNGAFWLSNSNYASKLMRQAVINYIIWLVISTCIKYQRVVFVSEGLDMNDVVSNKAENGTWYIVLSKRRNTALLASNFIYKHAQWGKFKQSYSMETSFLPVLQSYSNFLDFWGNEKTENNLWERNCQLAFYWKLKMRN